MKFTLEWLLSHIDTNLSVEELSNKLISLGIEVEKIIDNSKKFENFVIGCISKIEKHPDANKLSLCEVEVGKEKPLQIVCGAHNVKVGMKVAVALVGAIIPSTGIPLKKGKIRGIESQGMMCSASELMMSDMVMSDMEDNDGIMDLSEYVNPVGASLAQTLSIDDIIFDVSITPNRSDCFSVRGIAKYLVAAGAGSLKPLIIEQVKETIDDVINVDLQTEGCQYFSCKAVKGISSSIPTPSFIKKRLSAIGQTLIFAPIDIANYICIDIGQPMHIFDLDKIQSLIVRDSYNGEILNALNGNEVNIPENTIVVSSKTSPLSIAGIMGGVSSSFSEETKNILIESAYFDKVSIALAGQKIRILSDSRTRNERGTDPKNVNLAMEYASYLLSQSCQCHFGKTMQYGKLPENRQKIVVSFEKFKNLSGFGEKEWNLSKSLLEKLEIEILFQDKEKIEVLTPSFRHDLNIEEDIIEEILILIGYDNVDPIDLPILESKIMAYNDERISELLVNNGYNEVKTFSFSDSDTCLLFLESESLIKLRKPLTNEFALMRPSVICSLLKCIKNNQNKNQMDCSFFEIGKKFSQKERTIQEETMLTIILTGKNHSRSWMENNRDVSIYDVRAMVEKILSSLEIANYKITTDVVDNYYHPGRSGAYIFRKNEKISQFGEIHPNVLRNLDITGRVVAAEIFLDILPQFYSPKKKSTINLSPYQPVIRDFSFVVEKHIEVDSLISNIKKTNIPSLYNINIFDIYELEEDKKAVGIEITFYPQKETLNESQISDISAQIIETIHKNCGGELRS